MKNIKETQLKKAIFMTSEEFEELLNNLGMEVEFSCDGITVHNSDGEVDFYDENLNESLSEYFDVTVTSVHIDDCDYIGVWIVYT